MKVRLFSTSCNDVEGIANFSDNPTPWLSVSSINTRLQPGAKPTKLEAVSTGSCRIKTVETVFRFCDCVHQAQARCYWETAALLFNQLDRTF
jgi:hypothetical protein